MSDLNAIRNITMLLFDSVPIKPLLGGLVVQHPFVDSMSKYNPYTRKMLDLSNKKDAAEYRKIIEKLIKTLALPDIFPMINHPWLLTWFKYVCQNMDEKDFAKYLKASWVLEENPNQDVNVSREEAVQYFRDADKQILMSPEEQNYYNSLPETLTVYRGVSVGREKFGLSWTDNADIAEWFKRRFDTEGEKGYLLKASISKAHVLAYFNADLREEEELVVDVFSIRDRIEVIEGAG